MKTNIPAIEGGVPVRSSMLGFHRAWIQEDEINEVVDTLRSGWLTTGPRTKNFEASLARFLKVNRVVCLNSCTSALHLALTLFDVQEGDEVITTPITFPSTANVIVHRGARVVFADVNPDTLNIDPIQIEQRITANTRAIMPVHMAGQACDLESIRKICDIHNLALIQDAAHALESTWDNRRITDYGDLCAYSFYATKNITCGEGGALAGNNDELLDRAAHLSMFGISKDAWKRYNLPGYQHWETTAPGYKYNMFDIQAGLGSVQLKKIDMFRNIRLRYVERYNGAFKNHPNLVPVSLHPKANHAYYLFIIRLNLDSLKCSRDEFMKALESENIGVGVHFRSLLDQKFYRDAYPDQIALCPNALAISNSILSLPLYPAMADADCDDVIRAVLKLLEYYTR